MRSAFVAGLMAALLFVSGCAGALSSGAPGSGLGPDGPAGETAASTLPQRVEAGVQWLWACVVVLRAKGVADKALAELAAMITDVSRLKAEGNLVAARELFADAWNLAVELRGGQ